MIKNGGYWMKASLHQLFNAAFENGKIPTAWRNGMIIPIFKDGDPEVASNYRGITLLGKIFVTILERRLSRWYEEKKIFVQEKVGFRRTTVNHIFTLAELIQRRKRDKKPTYCCFLDIKKAMTQYGEKDCGKN